MKRLLTLIGCIGITISVSAQVKNVAILETVDKENTVSYMYEVMIRSELEKSISKTSGYYAFSRSDIDQMMKEINFQISGMVSDDQIKKLGVMTGADFVCVAEAIVDGDNFFVTAKIINVETARIERSDNELMQTNAQSIKEGCEKLANKLLGVNTPAATSKTTTSPDKAPDTLLEQGIAAMMSAKYGDAYYSFSELYDTGDKEACYYLAQLFYRGDGVQQSNEKAKQYAEEGISNGKNINGYILGALNEGEVAENYYKKAFDEMKSSAESGNAISQCNLGYMYASGKGVSQDYYEALKWYRKSAEQGYARAQCNLGNMYCNGEGVSQDKTEAVNWYRKAAEQGDARTQCNLG
ncbi:MAG: SEL1-like repeat protein, partial [Bacteroidales bacterium]|nr:SEL1-like repeat protein [Bacteroidales bacterium]